MLFSFRWIIEVYGKNGADPPEKASGGILGSKMDSSIQSPERAHRKQCDFYVLCGYVWVNAEISALVHLEITSVLTGNLQKGNFIENVSLIYWLLLAN